MKPYFFVVAATAFGLTACDQIKQDAQQAVEKTGEAVEATAEGAQAVAEGAWDATKATGEAVGQGAQAVAEGAAVATEATATAAGGWAWPGRLENPTTAAPARTTEPILPPPRLMDSVIP